MSYLDQLKKLKMATIATATTDTRASGSSVSTYQRHIPENPMSPAEEKAIRTWCSYIGEQDPELINEVLSRCDKVIDARRYFLKRSKEAVCST